MTSILYKQNGSRRISYAWSHGPHPFPLVVLHGLGDSSIHTYMPIFESTVLQDTPALFIDLPGFGYSAEQPDQANQSISIESLAEDISLVFDQLGIRPRKMFGHSMGANVALTIAHRDIDRWENLVLAEPLLDRKHSILASSIARADEDAFVEQGHKRLIRATSLQAHRGDVAAASFLPVIRMADPRALHRAATSLIADRDPDFLRMLMSCRQGVRLLVGERTNADLTPFQKAEIRVHIIESAGHNMVVERPSVSACAILRCTD